MLAALLPGSDDDAGRQVPEPNGALSLVDVLTSGAARTKGINFTFSQQVCVRFRQFDHVLNKSLKETRRRKYFPPKACRYGFQLAPNGL